MDEDTLQAALIEVNPHESEFTRDCLWLQAPAGVALPRLLEGLRA